MSQCSCENCDLEVFENSDKCIFHCEKSTWIIKVDPKNNDWDFGTEVAYYWDDKKVKKFWKKFKRLIKEKKDLSEKESYYRFDGFIFPRMSQDTFKDYIIDCDLIFTESCNFEDNVEFFNTTFNGKVYFNNCKIKGNVSFVKSIFNDRFTFNDMKEIKEVYFRFARFKKKVEFKKSECDGINLENTKFKDLADFYQSKFKKVNFEKTDFEKISVFSKCEFNCDVDFKYTKFLGKAIFMDTVVTGKLNLRNAIFDDEANFLDITSKKRKEKEGQFIGEPTDIEVVNRETARIIKNFHDNSNNIIEANRFYKLEMNKKLEEFKFLNLTDYKIFEKLVFRIHWLSSNHSQSWFVAFFWIIFLTLVVSYFSMQDFILMCKNEPIPEICKSFINLIDPEKAAIWDTPLYKLLENELFSLVLIGSCMVILIFCIYTYFKEPLYLYTILAGTLFFSCIIYVYLTSDVNFKYFANILNPFSIMKGDEPITFGGLIYKIIIAYLIYQLIISIRQNTRRK